MIATEAIRLLIIIVMVFIAGYLWLNDDDDEPKIMRRYD